MNVYKHTQLAVINGFEWHTLYLKLFKIFIWGTHLAMSCRAMFGSEFFFDAVYMVAEVTDSSDLRNLRSSEKNICRSFTKPFTPAYS